MLFLAGCGQREALDYAFAIKNVSVRPVYQSLDIRIQQQLELSSQAREALEHGVTLTIRLDLELRNDNDLIVANRVPGTSSFVTCPLSSVTSWRKSRQGN